ncbi:DUF4113 domain-containing protein [Candidatus Dojkabacteria bacterium]|nr:DUF4113 domain-containing protein [Candidatus Dojkabacteria bacterium]
MAIIINKKIYALVDCNNFFVSCERVFNPKLRQVPVVVLTNNDGCIIARSNEAKALGIKMAEPFFKCRDYLEANNVKIFSPNFRLYGDMSHRVMSELESFCSKVEVYSIDEAFLDLSEQHINDYHKWGQQLVDKVYKNIGIPVTVGIGANRTLAKIATEIAKHSPEMNGVLDLEGCHEKKIDEYLKKVEIQDIWGIGRKYAVKLRSLGFYSAYDLKNADIGWIRKKLTVMGQRIVMELNGKACRNIDDIRNTKKAIASTRSFGKYVTTKREIAEAVSLYVARAVEKLRRQKSRAESITLYIRTNPHKSGEQYYSNSGTAQLEYPSSFTPDFVKLALKILDNVYVPGKKYKKAGVFLTGIVPESVLQRKLFHKYDSDSVKINDNLMKCLDTINGAYGKRTLRLASEGFERRWYMKQNLLSKRFTSSWDELLVVGG